jgi:hypothetical protein
MDVGDLLETDIFVIPKNASNNEKGRHLGG